MLPSESVDSIQSVEGKFFFLSDFRLLAATATCADVAKTYWIHQDPEPEDK